MCAKELASDLWPTMSSRHLRFFESPDLRRSHGQLKIRVVSSGCFRNITQFRTGAPHRGKAKLYKDPFWLQDPFLTLRFRNPTVFTIFTFPLILYTDYMSSYRKTMPSFTLVLTSGHPSSSFCSLTIQPFSAMLPTPPDFLMVRISLNLSHPC